MYRIIAAAMICLFAGPLHATVDESRSLHDILEKGTLSEKDCERYRRGEHDEETTLRCGKWMFFYDSMERPGLPADLVDLIRKNAPNTAGDHLQKFGLIRNPYSDNGIPVGLSPGPKLPGGVKTYAMTCASCHFAQLPSGVYKVGHPNSNFDFARLMLSTALLPNLALQPKKVLPAPVAKKMQPLIDEFFGAKWSRLATIIQTLRLVPSAIVFGQKPLTDEQMTEIMTMPHGVLDPMAPPAYDDTFGIPLRILPLWGIPSPDSMEAAGSNHGAMLTSTGGTPDLTHIYLTGAKIVDQSFKLKLAESFDASYYVPLTQYILSLKAPKNPAPINAELKAQGAKIFSTSCASCHNGPGYAGTKIHSFEEIGTDALLADMYGPNAPNVSLVVEPYEITSGVRAPRLEGWWSIEKLLHNGSVDSLEELLCVEGPRVPDLRPGFSNQGHEFGCEDYTAGEKQALIHFLETL